MGVIDEVGHFYFMIRIDLRCPHKMWPSLHPLDKQVGIHVLFYGYFRCFIFHFCIQPRYKLVLWCDWGAPPNECEEFVKRNDFKVFVFITWWCHNLATMTKINLRHIVKLSWSDYTFLLHIWERENLSSIQHKILTLYRLVAELSQITWTSLFKVFEANSSVKSTYFYNTHATCQFKAFMLDE